MRIDLTNLQSGNRTDLKSSKTLKQGDVLRARIVDIKGDMVKLQLVNGETIEAKLDTPLDMEKGKSLNFTVKDLSEGKLVISPAHEESSLGDEFVLKNKSAIMDRILNLNKLNKDDKNLNIIKNMVSYKMPLKEEDIRAISKYTDKLISLLNLKDGDILETLSNGNPLDIDINKLIKLLEGGDEAGNAKVNDKNAKLELEKLIVESDGNVLEDGKTESTKLDKNSSFKEASLQFLKNAGKSNAENSKIVNPNSESITSENTNTVKVSAESPLKNIEVNPKNIEVTTTSGEKVIISRDSISEVLKSAMESVDGEDIQTKLNQVKNIEVKTVAGETKLIDTKTLTDALKASLLSASEDLNTTVKTDEGENTNTSNSTSKLSVDVKLKNIEVDQNQNNPKNIEVTTTSGEKVTISRDSISEALKSAMESVDGEDIQTKLNQVKNIEVKTVTGETKLIDTKTLTDALKALLSAESIEPSATNALSQKGSTDFKDVTELIKNELKNNFNGENKTTDIIQKLTFLVKSDVEVTVNNLIRLDKFLEQNQTVSKDLGEVLELATKEGIIDEKTKIQLLDKIKTLDLKFDGRDSEKLKVFQSDLKEVSEKLLSTINSGQKSSEELSQKANNLNNDIAFLNKINDKNTLMLIPFTMNQKELENNLYVMSKKKVSSSGDNIKVYMNLNTSNLDNVKILCDYSYDKLNVNFKVKENFLKLFETSKVELKQILESKGYENTTLSVSKQKDSEDKVLDIISHDDTINYMLNIKV